MNTQPAPATVSDFNPIAWGQFHLRGGWRSFWPTTVGYAAVVGAGLMLVARLTDGTPQALAGVKTAFTGLQAGLLIIFICSRVSTSIRQDLTSRMIESHRLMPMSPAQAVLGYLVGPSAQPLAICGANVLLGWGLCRAVGTPIDLWLTVNAVLLLFAVFAVVLAAFGALTGRQGGVAVGWIGTFVAMMNFFTIGAILPGVNVLATPVMGSTVFDMSVAGGDAVAKYAPSTVFQFWIAAVCFAGGCRRYRRDDRPALGWDLGLLLLAGWVATSWYGIAFWDEFRPGVMRGAPVNPANQVLGSIILAMLLALVPLSGAAWSAGDWASRRAGRDPALRRRPPSPALVALCAAAVTLALVTAPSTLLVNADDAPVGSPYHTFATLAAFYLATVYALRILLRVTTKLLYPMLLWLMGTWLLPIAIDYIRWWVRGEFSEPMIGRASGFGALGAMLQIWAGDPHLANVGIQFQALLATGMAVAYYATGQRRLRQPPVTRA